jgi:hypothetical protein
MKDLKKHSVYEKIFFWIEVKVTSVTSTKQTVGCSNKTGQVALTSFSSKLPHLGLGFWRRGKTIHPHLIHNMVINTKPEVDQEIMVYCEKFQKDFCPIGWCTKEEYLEAKKVLGKVSSEWDKNYRIIPPKGQGEVMMGKPKDFETVIQRGESLPDGKWFEICNGEKIETQEPASVVFAKQAFEKTQTKNLEIFVGPILQTTLQDWRPGEKINY